jgi:hypothetical protein
MFDVALVNRTPFAASTHVQMDGEGQEVLVAVACATFYAPDDDESQTFRTCRMLGTRSSGGQRSMA